jgi:hypothetical protein
MQTEPHESSFDFPHETGINGLLPSRPSKSAISFDSETTVVRVTKTNVDEELEDSNLHNTPSRPSQGEFTSEFSAGERITFKT